MTTQLTTSDQHDSRRRQVAGALAWAPGLVRYAARYTRSIDDAEDAYQCAMEIALTRAPADVGHTDFMRWLHTVVRHEAIRIRSGRHRELPTDDHELDESLQRSAEPSGPQAVAEWRERYRAIQDGLCGLTEGQRVCLMMRVAGLGRQEIGEVTGFSVRTVGRNIDEARQRLREFEVRLQAGRECERAATLMDRVVDGEATGAEQRQLARHTRHCAPCRQAYRAWRERMDRIASLVPAGLALNSDLVAARPVDVTAVVGWWERLSGAATVRTGQAMNLMLDLPQLAASRAGASAVVAAGLSIVGAPMVVQAVRAEPAEPRVVQAEAPSSPAVATPPVRTSPPSTAGDRPGSPKPSASTPRTLKPSGSSIRTRARPSATRSRSSAPVTPSSGQKAAPVRQVASRSAGSASVEFGP